MRDPLVLTLGTGVTGEGAALWVPGRAPATGHLEPGWAEATGEALAALLRPPVGLLLAASDVGAARAERQAAERLATLLEAPGMRAVRDALVAEQVRHGALDLAVDGRQRALIALPWELLGALPPGRSPLAGARVLRLAMAEPRAVPAPRAVLVVRLWVPDATDPTARAVAAGVEALVAGTPGLALESVPGDPGAGRPGQPGPAVLHVVAHGHAGLEGIGVHGGDGVRAAETVSRGLRPWLDGCGLAVADVCAGAGPAPDPADAPVWRLALEGAPVVVGPRTRWAREAGLAFARGLYGALAQGEPVVAAVEAGRQALRQLALAHDSARWWAPLAIVGTPLAAGLRLAPPPLRVAGWPVLGPDAAAVVRAATERARGYLGAEHLLEALADPLVPLPPELAALRPAWSALAGSSPPQPLAGPAAPSPRLLALGAELPEPVTARALAQALVLVPWIARAFDPAARARLLAPSDDDGRGTLPLEPVAATPPPGEGLALEVEGGPEDGRLLVLRAPGDRIGRWDPGQPGEREGRLYVDRVDGDRTLSRQHLRLLGGHRVELRGASRLLRPGEAERPVQGPVELRAGDLLVLGAATRLRVLG